HWPWIWFHTIDRLKFYFNFHLHHWHYNFEFLGHNYNNPPYPLSFPWVETALTVPVVTLALGVAGALVLARRPLTDDATLAPRSPPGTRIPTACPITTVWPAVLPAAPISA